MVGFFPLPSVSGSSSLLFWFGLFCSLVLGVGFAVFCLEHLTLDWPGPQARFSFVGFSSFLMVLLLVSWPAQMMAHKLLS